MAQLTADIAAFDRMKGELEAKHLHAWVVFHRGRFVEAFPDFESAATAAVERFDEGPYLIRQVGAGPIQLPGGMVFRPAHALDTSGLLARRRARPRPTCWFGSARRSRSISA